MPIGLLLNRISMPVFRIFRRLMLIAWWFAALACPGCSAQTAWRCVRRRSGTELHPTDSRSCVAQTAPHLLFTLLVLLLTACGGGGGDPPRPAADWITVDSAVPSSPITGRFSGTAWVSERYVQLSCSGIGCLLDQGTDHFPGVTVSWHNRTTGASGAAMSQYGGGTGWKHRWTAEVPLAAGENEVIFMAFDASGEGGSVTRTLHSTLARKSFQPADGSGEVPLNTIFEATFNARRLADAVAPRYASRPRAWISVEYHTALLRLSRPASARLGSSKGPKAAGCLMLLNLDRPEGAHARSLRSPGDPSWSSRIARCPPPHLLRHHA